MTQSRTVKFYPHAKFTLPIIFSSLIVVFLLPAYGQTQTGLKKIRLALPTKTVSFLAFYVAHHKGFYKDEGVELEPIIMQPALASTAVLTRDIDYNGAGTGGIRAGRRNRPVKGGVVSGAPR